jgi:precorrin-6B methylase 2
MQVTLTFLEILFLLSALGFSLAILWSAFFFLWRGVPFVPTSNRVVDAMIDVAGLKSGQTVMDLGAGDGRILMRAAKRVPGICGVGYEGSVIVWFLAQLRLFFSRRNVVVHLGDFLEQDLSSADAVFLYLGVYAMKVLEPKLLKELRPGTIVVSHAFRFPSLTPSLIKEVPMWYRGTSKVYQYVWPKKAQ